MVARDHDVTRRRAPQYCELDRRADGAANLADSPIHAEAGGIDAVDLGDDVAAAQARLLGGGASEHRGDHQTLGGGVGSHRGADAAEGPGQEVTVALQLRGGQVGGEGIPELGVEGADEALGRAIEGGVPADGRARVLALDGLPDLVEGGGVEVGGRLGAEHGREGVVEGGAGVVLEERPQVEPHQPEHQGTAEESGQQVGPAAALARGGFQLRERERCRRLRGLVGRAGLGGPAAAPLASAALVFRRVPRGRGSAANVITRVLGIRSGRLRNEDERRSCCPCCPHCRSADPWPRPGRC